MISNFNLPNLSQIVSCRMGPSSILIEEVEDIFIELVDDGYVVLFTEEFEKKPSPDPIKRKSRSIPNLELYKQDLLFIHRGCPIQICIYDISDGDTKNGFPFTHLVKDRMIDEKIIQKIVYRLYNLGICVMKVEVLNFFILSCVIPMYI